MQEIETIQRQVELTALSIAGRVARIHDALYSLSELTCALFSVTANQPEAIDRWLTEKGFARDQDHLFEQLPLLEKLRAGQEVPGAVSYFWPQSLEGHPEARFRLYALRDIGPKLEALRKRLAGVSMVYYQDITNTAFSSPAFDVSSALPNDFDWLSYHSFTCVEPSANPHRSIRWTPPNIDYAGEGLITCVSIPVYHQGRFLGVWSIDVPLRVLHKDALLDTPVQEQSNFITDYRGNLVAHKSIEAVSQQEKGAVFRQTISALGGDFAKLDLAELIEKKQGQFELFDQHGRRLFCCYHIVDDIEWILFATFPVDRMVEAINRSFSTALDRIRSGDLSYRMDAPVSQQARQMVEAYNEMASALEANRKDRERTLEQLRHSQQYNRQLFEGSPVGLLLLEPGGQIVDANAAIVSMLGHEHSELMKLSLWDITPPEQHLADQEQLRQIVTDGHCEPTEKELLARDGKRVASVVRASLLSRDGQQYVLASAEDIRKRRELEQRVLLTQKMQVIGQLAGGVAHDFNNLLTAILGSCEVLAEVIDEDHDLFQYIDCINQASHRASALTRQLLTFSKKQVLMPKVLEVGTVLRDTERLLRRLIGEDVQLNIKSATDLGRIRLDESQLVQVFLNLAVNAREAMPGGGTLVIEARNASLGTTSGASGGFVLLQVCDTGVGMDEGTCARIFEPLFTTKRTGTGLGLATVHNIVTEAGGKIAVDSQLGHGTTFRIWFPRVDETARLSVRPPAKPSLNGSETIMVVDDEPLVRNLAETALQRRGYVVLSATNPTDALRLIRLHGKQIRLLITDVIMPQMNGADLSERAKALAPGLRVLFMSGYTDDIITRHGIETGGGNFLQKPFTPEALVRRVRDVLDSRVSLAPGASKSLLSA